MKLFFILSLIAICLYWLKIKKVKGKVKFSHQLISAIVFCLFLVLAYYPAVYFQEFFFNNKKQLLTIGEVELVDDSLNYLDAAKNLGFSFDEREQVYFLKNVTKNEITKLDEDQQYFENSTPFIDLSLKAASLKLNPRFYATGNKITAKLTLSQGNVSKIFPEESSFHSYTLAPTGVIYSTLNPQKPFLELFYRDLKGASWKILAPTLGHNYYPYYWQGKGILYFLHISRITAEGKAAFVHSLVHYHLDEKKILFNTVIGGEEKLNLRALKIQGDQSGSYLAYGSLARENKINFFYYPNENVLEEPIHFYLIFEELSKIHSFSFNHEESESLGMLLVGQKKIESGGTSGKKSLFKASLLKEKISTIPLDIAFYIHLLILATSFLCLVMSIKQLKVKLREK